MSLKHRIETESRAALRAGDKPRLAAIRLALAAIKQQEVDTRSELDDAAVQAVVTKLIKKGRDAAALFEAGGRQDLATKELSEVAVLESYLPTQLTEAELHALVARAIEATGAQNARDIGKVIGYVKREAAGRVDLGAASAIVRGVLPGA